jgi:hypothetical protein
MLDIVDGLQGLGTETLPALDSRAAVPAPAPDVDPPDF